MSSVQLGEVFVAVGRRHVANAQLEGHLVALEEAFGLWFGGPPLLGRR